MLPLVFHQNYNPFPTGSRVEIWWTGDKMWYAAKVAESEVEFSFQNPAPPIEVFREYTFCTLL